MRFSIGILMCVFLAVNTQAAIQRDDTLSKDMAEGSAKSKEDCKDSKELKALKAAAEEDARRAVQALMENGNLPADKSGPGDNKAAPRPQASLGLEKTMEPCR